MVCRRHGWHYHVRVGAIVGLLLAGSLQYPHVATPHEHRQSPKGGGVTCRTKLITSRRSETTRILLFPAARVGSTSVCSKACGTRERGIVLAGGEKRVMVCTKPSQKLRRLSDFPYRSGAALRGCGLHTVTRIAHTGTPGLSTARVAEALVGQPEHGIERRSCYGGHVPHGWFDWPLPRSR
jgi:hypothetical protein